MKEIYFCHDRQEGPTTRQSILEMSGYKVTPMTTSGQLLSAVEDHVPDLILIDALIEGQNGFDTVRELRRRWGGTDLPIVLCSKIYRQRTFREEAQAAGANHYLLHPIPVDTLVQLIGDLTSRVKR